MITTFYPPHHFGGDAVCVQRLALALASRGHEVHVIYDRDAFDLLNSGSTDQSTDQDEPEHTQGVHVHALKSHAKWLSPLATQQTGLPIFKETQIRALLNAFPPDVTHFHNISLVGGPGVLKLGRGVKLYSTHEHWLICPMHILWKFDREPCETRDCLSCQIHGRRPPQWWRSTDLMRRSLEGIDLFLSPSQFTAERHTQWGGLNLSFEVLPHFCDGPPEALSLPAPERDSPPYFLCVGRLEKIKGFQSAIAALAHYPDAELRIVGAGSYDAELRRLAAGIPRVRFMGHCANDNLHQLYRGAIATIFPSLCYETFGMVIIESLAHQTPVIVHQLGAQKELAECSGGGLTYSNEDQLIEAMRRLQNDSQTRNRLADAGHAYFRNHWTEAAHLEKYLGIIDRLRNRTRSA